MRLFESTWREGYEFYERFFDPETNQSVKNRINLPYEWYEPSSTGIYTYILDKDVKLEKKQGNAKEGRDNYGFLDPMYRNIRDNYWADAAYNLTPRIWYLDIETRAQGTFPVPEKAKQEITLMQFYDNKANIMFCLGTREWKHQLLYPFSYEVKYVTCKNEIELIETYLALFKKLDPLIIYAWNGAGFDFPYIHNRMKNLGMDTNRLSNYGKVKYSEREFMNQLEFSVVADGHFYIDLMVAYQKFVQAPRANYKLDYISEVELGENKMHHPEYITFDDFYLGNYTIPAKPTEAQKSSEIYKQAVAGNWEEVRELAYSDFVYYGCKDTYLIKRIDEKLNFTQLMIMISQKMGVQISDSMGTVKPWAQAITNKSMQRGQVLPARSEHKDPHVVGGFVREPQLGKHKWVLSSDVNSMYPLLGMVGFNMSPETFIPKYKLPDELRDIVLTYFNDQEEGDRLKLDPAIWKRTTELLNEHNMSLGINGAVFSKNQLGMIPEIVQEIYDSRKQAKKKKFQYEQQKVLIKHILKERANGQDLH